MIRIKQLGVVAILIAFLFSIPVGAYGAYGSFKDNQLYEVTASAGAAVWDQNSASGTKRGTLAKGSVVRLSNIGASSSKYIWGKIVTSPASEGGSNTYVNKWICVADPGGTNPRVRLHSHVLGKATIEATVWKSISSSQHRRTETTVQKCTNVKCAYKKTISVVTVTLPHQWSGGGANPATYVSISASEHKETITYTDKICSQKCGVPAVKTPAKITNKKHTFVNGVCSAKGCGAKDPNPWGWPFVNKLDWTYGYDSKNHPALDFATSKGTNVLAVADGTVHDILRHNDCYHPADANSKSYGNMVILKHVIGSRIHYSYYAHLDSIDAKIIKSEKVSKGQVVGKVGNTGHTVTTINGVSKCGRCNGKGYHLHLEVRDNNTNYSSLVNPLNYIKK